jgi:hypothetical protein
MTSRAGRAVRTEDVAPADALASRSPTQDVETLAR